MGIGKNISAENLAEICGGKEISADGINSDLFLFSEKKDWQKLVKILEIEIKNFPVLVKKLKDEQNFLPADIEKILADLLKLKNATSESVAGIISIHPVVDETGKKVSAIIVQKISGEIENGKLPQNGAELLQNCENENEVEKTIDEIVAAFLNFKKETENSETKFAIGPEPKNIVDGKIVDVIPTRTLENGENFPEKDSWQPKMNAAAVQKMYEKRFDPAKEIANFFGKILAAVPKNLQNFAQKYLIKKINSNEIFWISENEKTAAVKNFKKGISSQKSEILDTRKK